MLSLEHSAGVQVFRVTALSKFMNLCKTYEVQSHPPCHHRGNYVTISAHQPGNSNYLHSCPRYVSGSVSFPPRSSPSKRLIENSPAGTSPTPQQVRTMPPSNSRSPPTRYVAYREKPNRKRSATSTGAIISLTRNLHIITSRTTSSWVMPRCCAWAGI